MIKEILKEKEPIAYKTLKNSLVNGKLAHIYLLYGEHNPLKLDSAFLLAQSIIEGNNDFACEECNTCRRIKENKYLDLIYIDGYKETIKKDVIEEMLERFGKTAVEEAKKKVFIISNINNSSTKVLNMILKFIEEPTNDSTFGIFITDSIDTLLETIVSRCLKIPFKAKDYTNIFDAYISKGFEEADAHILTNIKGEYDDTIDLNDDKYLISKEYAYKTIDNLDNIKYLPVLLNSEFYPFIKTNKDAVNTYIDIMFNMINDAIGHVEINDIEYMNLLKVIRSNNPNKLLEIFIRAKDRANTNTNKALLLDQIMAQMIL